MPELKLRYFSKREAREVSEAISRALGRELTPLAELSSGKVAVVVTREGALLLRVPGSNAYVPALVDADSVSRVRGYVVVDEGAIRHVVNGANIMRPGIVEYSEFGRDEVVVVREGTYRKPIAVGIALVASEELRGMSRGQVVRNVHHLRDEAWELLRDEETQRFINKLIK
ncbi:MAG: PUA domain-containing protein [Conexivisphaera sp.]